MQLVNPVDNLVDVWVEPIGEVIRVLVEPGGGCLGEFPGVADDVGIEEVVARSRRALLTASEVEYPRVRSPWTKRRISSIRKIRKLQDCNGGGGIVDRGRGHWLNDVVRGFKTEGSYTVCDICLLFARLQWYFFRVSLKLCKKFGCLKVCCRSPRVFCWQVAFPAH